MSAEVTIRRLGPDDAGLLIDAAELFDAPPQPQWVRTFLTEPTHHLLLALREGRAIGFVSAVETTHPDKGTEMFLYELAVAEEHRRQGVGRALLDELAALARDRGCYDMWVLTDADNTAAVAAYTSSGAAPDGEHLMLTWDWRGGTRPV